MILPRGYVLRTCAFALASVLVAGCVSVPTEPRAISLEPDHRVHVERLDCTEAIRHAQDPAPAALDPDAIRITTWNIHKQDDNGWQQDLARFGNDADLLLLQELVLRPDIRGTLEGEGLQWVMASSFQAADQDIGVLTAARVPPVATCTQRVVEPLLRLPKSAVITWYALRGRSERLAVANMHSINFSLSLGTYREQLVAMREVLAQHRGPIVFAGDLNTWTAGRYAAVKEVADALGLTEIGFEQDRRRLFLGKQLDHIFVRGLAWTDSGATEVTSSDHNPVHATLRLAAH